MYSPKVCHFRHIATNRKDGNRNTGGGGGECGGGECGGGECARDATRQSASDIVRNSVFPASVGGTRGWFRHVLLRPVSSPFR